MRHVATSGGHQKRIFGVLFCTDMKREFVSSMLLLECLKLVDEFLVYVFVVDIYSGFNCEIGQWLFKELL